MFKNFLVVGILFLTLASGLFLYSKYGEGTEEIASPVIPEPTPLAKYSFENLINRTYTGSEIKLEKVIKEEETHTSYLFSFLSDGQKVTGQLNLPRGKGPFPVVVMLRGYVDKEVYFTGLGTRKAAGVFAENGFITLAPDYLGFGESDQGSEDILEVRFEKPITVFNLFQSIKTFKNADTDNLFLWGHSNGGQVAISYLEISQNGIPTILWAPVTRGFPDSVTDYLGELDDQGKMVIASISAFLKNYDPQQFSVSTYYHDIKASFQIHQGTADPLVKEEWTGDFVKKMREYGRSVNYYKYTRDDHNLSRNWDTVVARDLQFFKKNLK